MRDSALDSRRGTVELRNALDAVRPYTKTTKERLTSTWRACALVDEQGIGGDLVECGVWRGGSVMLMRMASPGRVCWLYDTFRGMTEPGPLDVRRDGGTARHKYDLKRSKGVEWAEASFKEVCENLIKVGVYDATRLRFIEGDVRRTLRDESNLPDRIAVLRLDTDFYDSTKIEMEVLYPKLQSGGVLLVDDYGHWMGARKAVADYLGMSNELKPDDYSGSWMVKR